MSRPKPPAASPSAGVSAFATAGGHGAAGGQALAALLAEVRACRLCAAQLPQGPRPVLQAAATARILVVGQAPGRRVHASGVPWDDPSGERLRDWMGLEPAIFYDPARVALLPMGFCYPGKGASGDLPPRPECAPAWRQRLLALLPEVRLTLAIGRYAIDWHLQDRRALTAVVADWQRFLPTRVPLPHPSPRNRLWLRRNPQVEAEIVPWLRQRIAAILKTPVDVAGGVQTRRRQPADPESSCTGST